MFQVILIVMLVILSSVLLSKSKKAVNELKLIYYATGAGSALLAVSLFIGLSVVYVDKDEIMLKDRIYGGTDMPIGQVIALEGQKGAQADVIMPGFKFMPFVRFIYDLEAAPMISIPANKYGLVIAKDGKPLDNGQVIANEWKDYNQMVNATTFLTNGGQKGTQLTIIPPGTYPINTYQFEVLIGEALQVKTGEVAVIRSNVQTAESCDKRMEVTGLDTALVAKGCKGVWSEPLYQGMHYLNEYAYVPTIISTRAQVWAYKGGYTTKKIDLTVNNDGSITQVSTPIVVAIPANAADKAINVRVEGWTVPVEARVTVQVSPENAPKVVAGVGTLQNVEDKITTPNIRDSLRTIGGSKGSKVLDFVSKRASISKKVLADIKASTEAAGVTIIDVNLGEPAIPPELLVANQRKQIATQLQQTYKVERATQRERIKTQREKATADQQPTLVKAEIAKKAAEYLKDKRELEGKGENLYMTQKGIGERNYLMSKAKGEKARANVLGTEKVFQLEVLKIVASNPAMIKVPSISVGAGAGLEGAAAIFGGASNLAKFMQK